MGQCLSSHSVQIKTLAAKIKQDHDEKKIQSQQKKRQEKEDVRLMRLVSDSFFAQLFKTTSKCVKK